MLRRANQLVDRARERIRLAAERDPHSWPERDDDRAILVSNGGGTGPDGDDTGQDAAALNGSSAAAELDRRVAGGDDRPPLGSPAPGAPDTDNAGRVSGPPEGVPHRTTRPRGSTPERERSGDGDSVPAALRIAAAWSWRVIMVGVALYLVLQLAGLLLEV